MDISSLTTTELERLIDICQQALTLRRRLNTVKLAGLAITAPKPFATVAKDVAKRTRDSDDEDEPPKKKQKTNRRGRQVNRATTLDELYNQMRSHLGTQKPTHFTCGDALIVGMTDMRCHDHDDNAHMLAIKFELPQKEKIHSCTKTALCLETRPDSGDFAIKHALTPGEARGFFDKNKIQLAAAALEDVLKEAAVRD